MKYENCQVQLDLTTKDSIMLFDNDIIHRFHKCEACGVINVISYIGGQTVAYYEDPNRL